MPARANVGMLGLIMCVIFAAPGGAAHKDDPNGTWKWMATGTDDNSVAVTLTLRLQGQKLSGQITQGKDQYQIIAGAFSNGEVTFKITEERGGNKLTVQFKGKVHDNSIKGKYELQFSGQLLTFDWQATRQ